MPKLAKNGKWFENILVCVKMTKWMKIMQGVFEWEFELNIKDFYGRLKIIFLFVNDFLQQ